MSQADELLKSAASTWTVDPDAEPHIIIDEDRVITVPDELKRIAVQYDHDIETVTFDCPRYWDGHDLSEMQIYINYMRPDGTPGSHIAENVTVDEEDDTIIHFNWTISSHVSEFQGKIEFLVCAKKSGDVVVGQKEHPAGIRWEEGGKLSDSSEFRCIAYGDGKFVAVGIYNPNFYYSSDGINWSIANCEEEYPNVGSIAYGGGKFVAVGNMTNKAYYSLDGMNWNLANGVDDAAQFSCVAYGNGLFVAADFVSTTLRYSTDGVNWTTGADNQLYNVRSIVYGNGKFVGVGGEYSLSYSTDGVTWTASTQIESIDCNLYDITYGDGKFVAAGINGILYSYDGIVWDKSTVDMYVFKSVCYTDSIFVAIGYNKIIYTSPDGIVWSKATTIDAEELLEVVYGNGTVVAIGKSGSSYCSNSYTTDIIEKQVINHWNSELNEQMTISEGLEVEEVIISSNPDIFAQLIDLMAETEADISRYASNAKASEEAAATSAAQAKEYLDGLGDEATQAAASAAEAKTYSSNASTSETNAKASEEAAAESASEAKASEEAAAASAAKAYTSEEAASTYATSANYYKNQTFDAAGNAADSARSASASETNAKASEEAAAASAAKAYTSEEHAHTYADRADSYKSQAFNAADAASASATNAATSETNAKASEEAAAASAAKAYASEEHARTYADRADSYKSQAFNAADAAAASATRAEEALDNISHIGMIIHSTTLDTMEKVIAIYGGTTWEKIEGRFLLGQSETYEIGAEGGEETHTLTVSEMPSHYHSYYKGTIKSDKLKNTTDDTSTSYEASQVKSNTEAAGAGEPHNNMPPYKVVYIWERTA